ncbi:MAG: hypothetical protein QXV22_00515 [Thermoplasmataceae archaeon]
MVIELGYSLNDKKIEGIFKEISAELENAYSKYGPMRSKHEAIAVVFEELNEVWDTIRHKEPDRRTHEEAVQLAAAVVAMINDLL